MNSKLRIGVFVILIGLTVAAFAPGVHAATSISGTTITLDNVGSESQDGGPHDMSWTQTVNSGASILIAGVVTQNDGSPISVTTFTYGGVPLTKFASEQNTGAGVDIELWELTNPTPGTGVPVIVTWGASGPSIGDFGGSGDFFGVSGIRGSAGANAISVTINIPNSAVGDLLIDAVGTDRGVLSPSSGQTEPPGFSAGPLGSVFFAAAAVKGAGSGFTESWTTDGSGPNSVSDAILVTSLIPVSTPIPEYPLGLAVLAVLTIVGYGLIRRRVARPK